MQALDSAAVITAAVATVATSTEQTATRRPMLSTPLLPSAAPPVALRHPIASSPSRTPEGCTEIISATHPCARLCSSACAPVYSLISRDVNVLAEQTSSGVQGNFASITRVLLKKIPTNEDSKMSYAYDSYIFHYAVKSGTTHHGLTRCDGPLCANSSCVSELAEGSGQQRRAALVALCDIS